MLIGDATQPLAINPTVEIIIAARGWGHGEEGPSERILALS